VSRTCNKVLLFSNDSWKVLLFLFILETSDQASWTWAEEKVSMLPTASTSLVKTTSLFRIGYSRNQKLVTWNVLVPSPLSVFLLQRIVFIYSVLTSRSFRYKCLQALRVYRTTNKFIILGPVFLSKTALA
jgi:hypothetical protein